MKKIDLKSKKFITLGIIFVLIILSLVVFLNKGLKEKALKILEDKKESVVDVVNSEDYKQYTGEASTYFDGKHALAFSFLYKNNLKIKKDDNARIFKILNNKDENIVTVYFTYKRDVNFTAEDYINNILNEDGKEIKILDVKFVDGSTSTIKYVSFENKNSEYFVEDLKDKAGNSWLLIVENLNAKDEESKSVARDVVRSFEVK